MVESWRPLGLPQDGVGTLGLESKEVVTPDLAPPTEPVPCASSLPGGSALPKLTQNGRAGWRWLSYPGQWLWRGWRVAMAPAGGAQLRKQCPQGVGVVSQIRQEAPINDKC